MENEDYIIYKHFEEEIEEALIKKLNKEKVPISIIFFIKRERKMEKKANEQGLSLYP